MHVPTELPALEAYVQQLNHLYNAFSRPLSIRASPPSLCSHLRLLRQQQLLDLFAVTVEARRAAVVAGTGNATPQAAWLSICKLLGTRRHAPCAAPERRGPAGLVRAMRLVFRSLPILIQDLDSKVCSQIALAASAHPSAPLEASGGPTNAGMAKLMIFLDSPRRLPRQPDIDNDGASAFASCDIPNLVARRPPLDTGSRDVTGQWVNTIDLAALLAEMERSGPLSHRLVSVSSGEAFRVRPSADACRGENRLFTPTRCLAATWRREGRQWHELNVFIGHHPSSEDDMMVHYENVEQGGWYEGANVDGRTSGSSSKLGTSGAWRESHWTAQSSTGLPHTFILAAHGVVGAVATLLQGLPYSPDVLFLNPDTLTCAALPHLDLRITMPKVLYVPMNPVVPPPVELITEAVIPERIAVSTSPGMPWLAHCSLSGILAILERHAPGAYVLEHVEHSFAVLVLDALLWSRPAAKQPAATGTAKLHVALDKEPPLTQERIWNAWYHGWFCSPLARYFSGLEAAIGPKVLDLGHPGASAEQRIALVQQLVLPIVSQFATLQLHPPVISRFDVLSVGPAAASALHQRLDFAGHGWEWLPWLTGAAFYNGSRWAWNVQKNDDGGPSGIWLRHRGQVQHLDGRHAGCWRLLDGEKIVAKMDGVRHVFSRIGVDQLELQVPAPKLQNHALLMLMSPQSEDHKRRQSMQRNYLAAESIEELPGLRWLIKEHGRCTGGVCDCFPPFRGLACDVVDLGLPRPRVKGALIWYLAHTSPEDIADLCTSLSLLWRHFNELHDYPVVLFHEGLAPADKRQILRATPNRLWFAKLSEEEFLPGASVAAGPGDRADAPQRGYRAWSSGWNHHRLGYRAVSRWQAGAAFHHPVFRDVPYAMYLDTDAYFPGFVQVDPIAQLEARGGVYACSPLVGHIPNGRENHLWAMSVLYIHLRHRNPRGTMLLRELADENLNFKGATSYVDFHVASPAFFRDQLRYGDYFEFLDSLGGWWHHAWYSTLAVTLGVAIHASDEEVLLLQAPYAHQASCFCGASRGAPHCVHHADARLAMSYWSPSRRAAGGLWLCWPDEELRAFWQLAGNQCTRDGSSFFCTGTAAMPAKGEREDTKA